MKNLGSVEFENLIGNRGVGQLIAIYGEKNINSIFTFISSWVSK